MPAVSIVVPCYNGGEFLSGLTASVAAQSFRDYELIVVNDGSTDRATLERLERLKPPIRVLHQENRGLPAARNAGFRAANGEFVLPLDCDDTIEPSYLAETVPLLKQAGADVGFVFTDERLVGERTGVVSFHFNRYDQLFVNRLSYAILLRRSAWEAVGGYDETMRDGYEDWEFNIRLAKAGFRGVHLKKPLVNYFVSRTGMLMTRSSALHPILWRKIRARHPDLYRPAALVRLWRAEPGKIGLGRSFLLLAAARLLPDSWFGAAVRWMRARRLSQHDPAHRGLATVQ